MINVKCPNKKTGFLRVFCKYGQKNCTKNVQPFQTCFSFFKQIRKLGWKVFERPSTPIFFICLYFIGVCGDENLKNIWHGLDWVSSCNACLRGV